MKVFTNEMNVDAKYVHKLMSIQTFSLVFLFQCCSLSLIIDSKLFSIHILLPISLIHCLPLVSFSLR